MSEPGTDSGSPGNDVARLIADTERRIEFRLDAHQASLDRATRDPRVNRAVERVSGATSRLSRVPSGLRRRVEVRRLRRTAVAEDASAIAEDLEALRVDAARAAESGKAVATQLEPGRVPVFEIPTSTDPLVSIIIPVHGAIDDVTACLESIAAFAPCDPFEVIIANDASDPDEFAPIRGVGGIVIVDNDRNLGFLRTCNRAARHARGAMLWFLNSDTELTPGAADALVATFDDVDVGVVGSKLIYPDGTLQEAGGLVWRDGSAWNVGRGDDPRRSEFDHARRVDYVSAASLMISRSLWDELDGFDTAFAPAYYEDTDLCMRVAQTGRHVVYQSGSVVVHHEGKSYGTDVAEQGKHHQVVNHRTFLRKWSHELSAHRANGDQPEIERDRSIAGRVLVIDARMLTPDQDSGSLRMQNLMLTLTRAGIRCTFVPHNMAADEPYAQQLRVSGVEVVGSPRHRSLDRFLRQRGRDFDVVVLSRLEVAAPQLTSVRRACPDATVVFDTVDLHFLRLARARALDPAACTSVEVETTRDDELAAVQRADVTLVCSTVERDLLGELVPHASVEVVGNVHLPSHRDIEIDNRSGVLFVGGFEHPPNVDAITWFVHDVLPLLTRAHPDLMVHVVGSRMVDEVSALAGPNVTIHGYVADLEPLLRSTRVSVAPLRFGAGVKGKVTQALAEGLPTVGTSVAIEGAQVVAGKHVLVADTAHGFAEQVSRLIVDDDLWLRIATAGSDFVTEQFGPGAVLSSMAEILGIDTARETVSG